MLTENQRNKAMAAIAGHLTKIASQEALEQEYYDVRIEYLQDVGDAHLLDVLRACAFTLEDL